MSDDDATTANTLVLNQKQENPEIWAFISGLKFFVFITLCIIGTAFLFTTTKGFIQEVIEEKYNKLSKNNVELLKTEMTNMQSALRTIISMDNSQTPPISTTSSDKFDEISKITYTRNKPLEFQSIYKSDTTQARPAFRVRSLEKVYGVLYQESQKTAQSQLLFVITDPELFEVSNTSKADPKTLPFAMSLRTDHGLMTKYYVATTNIGSLFSDFWLDDNEIARLSVRDLDTGNTVFNFEKGENTPTIFSSVHEFVFSGKRWEVRTGFLNDPVTNKLLYLPYFILYFGGFIAMGGIFGLYNTHTHARRVNLINKTLEQKNNALRKEIEKRQNLDKELGATEREKRAIVDAVSDIIFETNTQGKILFLNATWSKITGFSIEQTIGTELFNLLHPHDQNEQGRDFAMMVEGKKAAYRSFTRLRTSDGTFRAVELAISMIRQDEDKNLRVVGTITDVEQRERAEKALREAEKKYRTIVENAAGGIFQMTPEGVFLSSNPALARILGYESPLDLIKQVKDANREIYPDQQERKKFIHELETLSTIANHETQAYKKDGSTIWINENVRVVRDDEGNILYYEGSIEDITQRKESDFTLREAKMHSDMANRAKSEFLTNMSHELRTPLNAIIGFSEIIKDETFGQINVPEYKEYAADINKSGKNLLHVINEILDISKIEANQRQLQEDVVNVSKLIDDCLEIMKTKIAENQLIISKPYDTIPEIVAESLAVKQMIINVLSNAIKFTPVKGHITIDRSIDDDGSLRLSITDTGIGLDPSEIPKILSPFGQIENPLSKKHSGTGLGLTLVNSLIKLHGGTLDILSQKGIGTTVSLVFPAMRVHKPHEKQTTYS